MKKLLAVWLVGLLGAGYASADPLLMNGAGATFPYPIYSKWFDEYHKIHPEIQFNYQSIGSGGGIRQISSRTVDFGASDGPMTDQQLKDAPAPLMHFPTVLGGLVRPYHIEGGKTELRFTQKAIAGIFLGSVTRWNDPEIQKANADVKLPDAAIVVVHRSDGSGTSYCWTDFLSKISPQWAQKVGKGTSVNWPVGLGGKGNEGVAGLVEQTPDSIGYVELIYALQNKIAYGSLQNKAGRFVKCSLDSVSAAAAGAARRMPKDFRVSITDAPGESAYPASTFTWLLIYEKQADPAKGKAIVDFLHWMLTEGQGYTKGLGYAPLSPQVVAEEKAAMQRIQL